MAYAIFITSWTQAHPDGAATVTGDVYDDSQLPALLVTDDTGSPIIAADGTVTRKRSDIEPLYGQITVDGNTAWTDAEWIAAARSEAETLVAAYQTNQTNAARLAPYTNKVITPTIP